MEKILILEDDPLVRGLLMQIAKKVNDKVTILDASTSTQALQIAKKEVIDLFFLDVRLPDYSGILLAKQLRLLPFYQVTPIVFITADPTQELEAYRQTHCFDYIVKSLDLTKIEQAFERFLMIKDKPQSIQNCLNLECKLKSHILDIDDILYIEGMGKYTMIVKQHDCITYGQKLKAVSDMLPDYFLPVGQSYVVNVKHITKIDYKLNDIFIGDRQIKLSRGYKRTFKTKLKMLMQDC